jgi:hypothetical protein
VTANASEKRSDSGRDSRIGEVGRRRSRRNGGARSGSGSGSGSGSWGFLAEEKVSGDQSKRKKKISHREIFRLGAR